MQALREKIIAFLSPERLADVFAGLVIFALGVLVATVSYEALTRESVEIPFPHRSLYTGSVTEPFPIR